MSKDLVSRWFNKIGPSEKNKPLLIVSGIAYTPQQTYDEVMRGSPLGDQLQKLLEQGKFGTTFAEEQELMKQRLTMSLEEKPDKTKVLFVTLGTAGVQPKTYTVAKLLEEIKSDTPSKEAKQWIDNEASFVRRILQVR